MSRVYLAVVKGPAGFNKFQVVKRLLPSLANDPEFLNMFLEEARLSARLNHTNVVQINEVGFDGEHHFMAMEYLEGQSLESLVRRAGRHGGLPLPFYVRVLIEAAAGLHYAHEFADLDGRPLNIVHRDVSPHNVFVTYQGQVKVLDFGIAKAADSSLHTRTGMLKGKVAYMAPEQLRQSGRLDRRADIFALGVMLWQAVAGRRLWQDMSDLEVFQQLNMRRIPVLREVRPDAPEALVRVCERALAFDADHRFATASEFGDALESYLSAEGQRANGRELGAYVSGLFSVKRAEVQVLIEAALGRLSTEEHTPSAARLGAAPLSRSESGLLPTPSLGITGLESRPGGLRLSGPQGADSALWGVPSPSAPPGPPEAPGPRPRRLWAAAAVLTVGASVAAFSVASRSLRARPEVQPVVLASAPVAAAPAAPAAPPTEDAGARRTQLAVRAAPAQARLFVDDVPLSSNPGAAVFASDGLPHQVRAEAAGFATEMKVVVYDRAELNVAFQLRRDHRAAATWTAGGRTAGRPPAAAPPSEAAPPAPKATAKPTAPALDRESPWP